MSEQLSQERSQCKQILDCLCPVPHPLESYESQERYYHQDLEHMTKGELYRERDRVRWRLTMEMEGDSDAWLVERLEMVEALLKKLEGLRHAS